jgi:pyruvate formate lyase activating enzyme
MESGKMIFYKQNHCNGDGLCVKACPNQAISEHETFGKLIDRKKCTQCGICVDACLSGALTINGEQMTTERIIEIVKKDWLFYRNSGGGVTLSGGEPLAQADGAREILKGLKQNAIHTAIETTGCVDRAALEDCLPWLDLIIFDIKQTDTSRHKTLTGAGNEQILDNLRWAGRAHKKIWVRMPIVPGVNDDPVDFMQVADMVNEMRGLERVELLPYHPYGNGKYQSIGLSCPLPDQKEPDKQYMEQLRNTFRKYIKDAPVM